jgi:chromatin remodeling complex protein RSC6
MARDTTKAGRDTGQGKAGAGMAKANTAGPAKGPKGKTASGTTSLAKGGLAKPVTPSKDLAAIVGTGPLPRSEIVKRMWDYIKKNNLQNPQNKREILADDALKPIFGAAKVSMFEMNAHIARNVK